MRIFGYYMISVVRFSKIVGILFYIRTVMNLFQKFKIVVMLWLDEERQMLET